MSAWKSWADEAAVTPGSWANRYWLSYRRAEQLTELLDEQARKVSILTDALMLVRAENADLSEQLEAVIEEREAAESAAWPLKTA